AAGSSRAGASLADVQDAAPAGASEIDGRLAWPAWISRPSTAPALACELDRGPTQLRQAWLGHGLRLRWSDRRCGWRRRSLHRLSHELGTGRNVDDGRLDALAGVAERDVVGAG